jgi:hypothetical protein
MAAQKEIPMDDSELDALMAELDAETAGMVLTPTVAVAAAPEPTSLDPDDQEIADLAAELNATGQVSTNDAVALAQAEATRAAETPAPQTEEDELAALQAELDAEEGKSAPASVVAKKSIEIVGNQALEPVSADSKSGKKVGDDVRRIVAGQPTLVEQIAANKAAETAPTPVATDEPVHPNPEPAKKQPKLQFYLDVDAFKNEIAVSENNLDNCMMQQAGLFAWHASEGARAEAQYARVKLRFDVVEARLYDRHRKAIAAAGEKATEKSIENAVRQDPEWLQAKNLVIEAEMLASINKGAVEALRHRKDMVVQMGADRREEYKGQTRISIDPADVRARAIAAGKLAAA